VRGNDRFPAGGRLSFQPGQGPDHGQVGETRDVLADGGEVDVGQAGQMAVVEADDRDLAGDVDAGAEEDVEDAEGAAVVEGDDRGGPGTRGDYGTGGRGAVLFGQAAGYDVAGQAVAAHGGPVAAAPVGGAGRLAAVDVGDVAMAEGHEMVDGLADSVVVGGPHDVHARGGRRQPPGDGDHRELGGEFLQVGGGGLGAEQDQGLAAVGQQSFGGALLAAAGGHPGVPFAKAADTLALVAAVNRPGLRMNLDLYHAQIGEGNLIELLRLAHGQGLIGEIQVADVPGRREPGTGEINYPAIARAPLDLGYAGTAEAWASGDSVLARERFRSAFTPLVPAHGEQS
jgi:Xylose isomerase-like TIM barrel